MLRRPVFVRAAAVIIMSMTMMKYLTVFNGCQCGCELWWRGALFRSITGAAITVVNECHSIESERLLCHSHTLQSGGVVRSTTTLIGWSNFLLGNHLRRTHWWPGTARDPPDRTTREPQAGIPFVVQLVVLLVVPYPNRRSQPALQPQLGLFLGWSII